MRVFRRPIKDFLSCGVYHHELDSLFLLTVLTSLVILKRVVVWIWANCQRLVRSCVQADDDEGLVQRFPTRFVERAIHFTGPRFMGQNQISRVGEELQCMMHFSGGFGLPIFVCRRLRMVHFSWVLPFNNSAVSHARDVSSSVPNVAGGQEDRRPREGKSNHRVVSRGPFVLVVACRPRISVVAGFGSHHVLNIGARVTHTSN